MQSLRDYLNNTQQYESILDPDQNKVMDRMTDDMIRERIREYCTYDRQKYKQNELWPLANSFLKITKVDKDNNGWYVETKSAISVNIMSNESAKSFHEYCLYKCQKMDKQKGFLIEGTGIYFRWRKHNGRLDIADAPNFESTYGLPEELDGLHLFWSCEKSKKLDVRNKINVISLHGIKDLKISGNGCKNVIIHFDYSDGNIIVPDGVKIHHPDGPSGYWDLMDKLSKC